MAEILFMGEPYSDAAFPLIGEGRARL